MSTVQPKGEKIRQAIKSISNKMEEEESQSFSKLIQKAGQEFNLSPMEEEFLHNFFKESKKKSE
ncbi:MAG: hypothetical protein M0P57_06035 [Syntrophales bacterium]|jgi:hypothetical protein|nr:hypothetical protein [Syntrophales bacterium]MDY0045701.1 hypothetical protein [Syntrophales bacterium]